MDEVVPAAEPPPPSTSSPPPSAPKEPEGETPAKESAPIEFPAPSMKDFDEDVPVDEKTYCMTEYADLNKIKEAKIHCTACNKHIGLSAHFANRLKMHPMMRTLICATCLEFYNSGEFLKGDDGSELYCRWCGQGGQVYCCSRCPLVFCSSCIKRNYGKSKVEEIESADEWNCFLCQSDTLLLHRAKFWAARRYCNLKNKFALTESDPTKRDQIQKECQMDESNCCKKQNAKDTPIVRRKRKEKDPDFMEKEAKFRRRSSPMVKKVKNADKQNDGLNNALSESSTVLMKQYVNHYNTINSIKIAPKPNIHDFKTSPGFPAVNKYYMPTKKKPQSNLYSTVIPNAFATGIANCYSNVISNDNLNLSLESLTQGLDASGAQFGGDGNMNINYDDGNVVCTPDFPLPLEPMCELNEPPEEHSKVSPNKDNDVECLTPVAKLVPKPLSALTNPPSKNMINVVRLSEDEVSINKVTGSLKFRINPATLSSNKIYQLPDGRVFSVHLNSRIPGGYSASIINIKDKVTSPTPNPPPLRRLNEITDLTKNTTFPSWTIPVIPEKKSPLINVRPMAELKRNESTSSASAPTSVTPESNTNSQKDVPLPTEWYSFNLHEAADLISHVAGRLEKLKKQQRVGLRGKTVSEMINMHFVLDQLYKISIQRFVDSKANLNREFRQWLKDQNAIHLLNDSEEKELQSNDSVKNHETIFIDENSSDSNDGSKSSKNSMNGLPVIQSVTCLTDVLKEKSKILNDILSRNRKRKIRNAEASQKNSRDPLKNTNRQSVIKKNKSTREDTPNAISSGNDSNSQDHTDNFISHININNILNNATENSSGDDNRTSTKKDDDKKEIQIIDENENDDDDVCFVEENQIQNEESNDKNSENAVDDGESTTKNEECVDKDKENTVVDGDSITQNEECIDKEKENTVLDGESTAHNEECNDKDKEDTVLHQESITQNEECDDKEKENTVLDGESTAQNEECNDKEKKDTVLDQESITQNEECDDKEKENTVVDGDSITQNKESNDREKENELLDEDSITQNQDIPEAKKNDLEHDGEDPKTHNKDCLENASPNIKDIETQNKKTADPEDDKNENDDTNEQDKNEDSGVICRNESADAKEDVIDGNSNDSAYKNLPDEALNNTLDSSNEDSLNHESDALEKLIASS